MIIDRLYKNRDARCYEDFAPTLRSDRTGLEVVEKKQYKTTSGNDVSGTLRASMHKNGARNIVENIQSGRGYEGIVEESGNNVRIRKLTPKECFRLQGWKDEDFEKAEMVNSNSQLYKQAGNGVTVDVIKAIGERLKD